MYIFFLLRINITNKLPKPKNYFQKQNKMSQAESFDETPTTSDDEFIVSDSEMTDISSDSIEDDIAVLTESYLHLMEQVKILSKENKVIKDHLSKQQDLLWEIYEHFQCP